MKYHIEETYKGAGSWICGDGIRGLHELAKRVDEAGISDIGDLPEPLAFRKLSIRKTRFTPPESGLPLNALQVSSEGKDLYYVVKSERGLGVYLRIEELDKPVKIAEVVPKESH
ncbi:Uncharacterised protein [uncultured archaeon]|nr:Uncharacterised protein [uncultured archaeon]